MGLITSLESEDLGIGKFRFEILSCNLHFRQSVPYRFSRKRDNGAEMRRGWISGAALAVSLCIGFGDGGCAVYMAAHQPDAKDLSVLSAGQPRARLIAELGPPVSTQVDKGVRTDIFSFTQGYSGGAKAGRAVLHGAADVATLGLWEAVGTPTEGYFSGSQLSAQVTYDEHDRVTTVVPLKGSEEIQAVMTNGAFQNGGIQTSSTH